MVASIFYVLLSSFFRSNNDAKVVDILSTSKHNGRYFIYINML